MLELINKMLSAPKSRKKHGNCHCHQLKAGHKGTCSLGCFFQGIQYAYSQCPICFCTCDASGNLAQYHAIVAVTPIPAAQICNQDSRASVRSWLESSMNVNCKQRCSSAEFYTNAIKDGNIASNTVINIGNDVTLGQALIMAGNTPFDHGTLRALRSIVDNVRHPAGSTFSDYGDMNVHGRTTSADCCHTNNRLEGLPCAELYNLTSNECTMSSLSKDEMVSVAIAQLLQTPMMQRLTPALLPCYQSNRPLASALHATASTANSMKTPEIA